MNFIPAVIGLIRAGGLLANINGILFVVTFATAFAVGYTYIQRSIGASNATKVITKTIEDEAKKADEKSSNERSAAARPGALDRLRNDAATCPECVKGGNGKPVQKLAAPDHKAK